MKMYLAIGKVVVDEVDLDFTGIDETKVDEYLNNKSNELVLKHYETIAFFSFEYYTFLDRVKSNKWITEHSAQE